MGHFAVLGGGHAGETAEGGAEVVEVVELHIPGDLFDRGVGIGESLLDLGQAHFLDISGGGEAGVFLEKLAELGVTYAEIVRHILRRDGVGLLGNVDLGPANEIGHFGESLLALVVDAEPEQVVDYAEQALLEARLLVGRRPDGFIVQIDEVFVEADAEYRALRGEETVLHPAVDERAVEPYPEFVPSRGRVGAVGVPLAREEQEHAAAGQRDLVPGRGAAEIAPAFGNV